MKVQMSFKTLETIYPMMQNNIPGDVNL